MIGREYLLCERIEQFFSGGGGGVAKGAQETLIGLFLAQINILIFRIIGKTVSDKLSGGQYYHIIIELYGITTTSTRQKLVLKNHSDSRTFDTFFVNQCSIQKVRYNSFV